MIPRIPLTKQTCKSEWLIRNYLLGIQNVYFQHSAPVSDFYIQDYTNPNFFHNLKWNIDTDKFALSYFTSVGIKFESMSSTFFLLLYVHR